jgi:hypothetical protein
MACIDLSNMVRELGWNIEVVYLILMSKIDKVILILVLVDAVRPTWGHFKVSNATVFPFQLEIRVHCKEKSVEKAMRNVRLLSIKIRYFETHRRAPASFQSSGRFLPG